MAAYLHAQFALFGIMLIDALCTSQTDIVCSPERFCPTHCGALNTIALRFHFPPLPVTAIFADEGITSTLFFVFGEPPNLQKQFALRTPESAVHNLSAHHPRRQIAMSMRESNIVHIPK
jgi:hypothetical protein